MASSSQPQHLTSSRKVYARLHVSGLPWYIYNDHFDGYYRNEKVNESVLIFELTLNSSNNALAVGGVNIPLPKELIGKDITPNRSRELDRGNTAGIKAWHTSPDQTVARIAGYLASGTSLSDVLRTVILDVEYSWAASATHGMSEDNQKWELRINVQRSVGADRRDGTDESCRDTISKGQGSFRLDLKRNGEDSAEAEGALNVEYAEGLELLHHIPQQPGTS